MERKGEWRAQVYSSKTNKFRLSGLETNWRSLSSLFCPPRFGGIINYDGFIVCPRSRAMPTLHLLLFNPVVLLISRRKLELFAKRARLVNNHKTKLQDCCRRLHWGVIAGTRETAAAAAAVRDCHLSHSHIIFCGISSGAAMRTKPGFGITADGTGNERAWRECGGRKSDSVISTKQVLDN